MAYNAPEEGSVGTDFQAEDFTFRCKLGRYVVSDEMYGGEVKPVLRGSGRKQHELGPRPSHGQHRLTRAIHALDARPVTLRSMKRKASTVLTGLPSAGA